MKYSKYRGKVVDNLDPLGLGRIIALAPSVSEFPLSWAVPCVPFAGPGVGFFALPPIGANVWIEFEAGDPNYPIWTGCFWSEGEAPVQPAIPTTLVLKTELVTLMIDDGAGEVRLEARTPGGVQTVVLDKDGMKVNGRLVGGSVALR